MQELTEVIRSASDNSLGTFESYTGFLGAALAVNLLTTGWLSIIRNLKREIDSLANWLALDIGQGSSTEDRHYFIQSEVLEWTKGIVVTVGIVMAMAIYFSLLVVDPSYSMTRGSLALIWIAGFAVPFLVGGTILLNARAEWKIRKSRS